MQSCEQFQSRNYTWPAGMQTVAIVGNGPLTPESREEINVTFASAERHCSSVCLASCRLCKACNAFAIQISIRNLASVISSSAVSTYRLAQSGHADLPVGIAEKWIAPAGYGSSDSLQ